MDKLNLLFAKCNFTYFLMIFSSLKAMYFVPLKNISKKMRF